MAELVLQGHAVLMARAQERCQTNEDEVGLEVFQILFN